MSATKTILVTGATGAQGGSVARHLLSAGHYQVKCLTRHPDAEKAQALRAAGAEVIGGDLEDRESLRRATAGCDGVFGVTNYWEHFDAEYEQGRNLIDAVAEAGVSHFILSTLPSASKISGGQLEVPHFDIKARLEEYARGLMPSAIFIHVAFYYENFLNFSPPRRQEDGTYVFGFPQGDTPLAGVAAEDVGGVVAPLFANPSAYANRVVGVVGDDLPPHSYAETMSHVLGREIRYQYIPREVFASFGFPGADDLANMFEFNRLYLPNRAADLKESRALYPSIRNFATWVEHNRDKLAAVLEEQR